MILESQIWEKNYKQQLPSYNKKSPPRKGLYEDVAEEI